MISQLTACVRLWPYCFPGQDRKSEFSARKAPPPKNLHQRILCACMFKTALSDRVLHFCRYKLGKRSFLRFHYANKRGRIGQTTWNMFTLQVHWPLCLLIDLKYRVLRIIMQCVISTYIYFFQVVERNAQPEMSLLQYLRNYCILRLRKICYVASLVRHAILSKVKRSPRRHVISEVLMIVENFFLF